MVVSARLLVVLAATLLGARAAHAQPIQGLYVGAGVGYGLLRDENVSIDPVVQYAPVSSAYNKIGFTGGVTGLASIGYGAGNGLRVEIEGSYRTNDQQHSPTGGNGGAETKYGFMGNVLFDVDPGLGWIYPYFGAGAGFQEVSWKNVTTTASGILYGSTVARVNVDQSLGKFAYQAIIGAAFPVSLAPGLSLTVEYRYLGVAGSRNYAGSAAFQYAPTAKTRVRTGGDDNHTVLIGLRLAFDAPDRSGAAVRPPLAEAPGVAAVSRTYLVYFDWDRADLTPRARDIVAEAVRASARVQHTRIEVVGNADTSGTAGSNKRLSLRRAQNVAAEMERYGVPPSIVDVHGDGDSGQKVATGPGVREPQNRRVEIVYR